MASRDWRDSFHAPCPIHRRCPGAVHAHWKGDGLACPLLRALVLLFETDPNIALLLIYYSSLFNLEELLTKQCEAARPSLCMQRTGRGIRSPRPSLDRIGSKMQTSSSPKLGPNVSVLRHARAGQFSGAASERCRRLFGPNLTGAHMAMEPHLLRCPTPSLLYVGSLSNSYPQRPLARRPHSMDLGLAGSK